MLEFTRAVSVPYWLVIAKLASRPAADRWRRAATLETLVIKTAVAEMLSVAASAAVKVTFWTRPKSLAATPLILSTDATV
jgi:hypothetical protein